MTFLGFYFCFMFGAITKLREFKDWRPWNIIDDFIDPLAHQTNREYIKT